MAAKERAHIAPKIFEFTDQLMQQDLWALFAELWSIELAGG